MTNVLEASFLFCHTLYTLPFIDLYSEGLLLALFFFGFQSSFVCQGF